MFQRNSEKRSSYWRRSRSAAIRSETGSRAYGMAHNSSDADYRGFYLSVFLRFVRQSVLGWLGEACYGIAETWETDL